VLGSSQSTIKPEAHSSLFLQSLLAITARHACLGFAWIRALPGWHSVPVVISHSPLFKLRSIESGDKVEVKV